jgi:hypothetical protein
MKTGLLLWLAIGWMSVPTAHAASLSQTVSKDERAQWLDHLTPLPREVDIAGKLALPRGDIALAGRTNGSPRLEQAALELRELVGAPAPGASAAFTIHFQIGGPEADALNSLKNAGQAYRIGPADGGRGLRLVALSERGLYHGAKTLQQLLRARSTASRIELPLVTVRDWPEMETRGLWGSDSFDWLPLLANWKLNYQENIARLTVDRATKRGRANVKPGTEQLLTLGPRLGIEHAPVVLHLEQLEGTGLFEVYPELRGKNGGKPGVICYSQPAFVPVLADWIAELGSLPGVEHVDVWFTENLNNKGGCKCDSCRGQNWALAEARAVIAAWRQAQQRVPNLRLRVLTSEATYDSNAAIFDEIPPEVGIWYYHSLLTYTARSKPMIDGPVLKAAQAGRWIGVCPSLVAHVGWAEPFTCPQFVHARMSEFTSKGLRGMIGYATPRTMIARFNIEAAAEWLWNPTGRTPREFARAWAVRQKIAQPDTFAEWADTLGPAEWAIYGSEWPAGEKRKSQGTVAALLARGALPELGSFKWGVFGSPWGDIRTPEELRRHAAAAARAVTLARRMGLPEFVQESLVVQGYADALCALWELKQLVTPQGLPPEKRAAAKTHFAAYDRALQQAATALPAWERAVPGLRAHSNFTREVVETLQTMRREMKETARTLGVPDS